MPPMLFALAFFCNLATAKKALATFRPNRNFRLRFSATSPMLDTLPASETDNSKMTRRQIITLLVLTVIFFLVGQFEYENLYRLTLYSVKTLSSVPLSFYGKFPFWFGDTRFSLIIASIPLTIFLTSKILRQSRHTLAISVLTYTIYFICSYLIVCFWTSLSFHSLNDFYHGEDIKRNLREVNINETFLATILIGTTLTVVTFLIVNLIKWTTRKLLEKQKTH